MQNSSFEHHDVDVEVSAREIVGGGYAVHVELHWRLPNLDRVEPTDLPGVFPTAAAAVAAGTAWARVRIDEG